MKQPLDQLKAGQRKSSNPNGTMMIHMLSSFMSPM